MVECQMMLRGFLLLTFRSLSNEISIKSLFTFKSYDLVIPLHHLRQYSIHSNCLQFSIDRFYNMTLFLLDYK